jgi:hypothetical protein
LPQNTPALGIPTNEMPPAQLEHVMTTPLWDATGKFIYVASFVLTQVETDFTILERADASKGGSVFLESAFGLGEAFGAPDRRVAVFLVGSARGDVQLVARALDPNLNAAQYAWATTKDDALYVAPAWAPTSAALAALRCPLSDENRCDLVLLTSDQPQPTVLIPDVLGGIGPYSGTSPGVAWGQ